MIAFRMLQGIGGSMLNPVAMSITQVFTEKLEERKQLACGALLQGFP